LNKLKKGFGGKRFETPKGFIEESQNKKEGGEDATKNQM